MVECFTVLRVLLGDAQFGLVFDQVELVSGFDALFHLFGFLEVVSRVYGEEGDVGLDLRRQVDDDGVFDAKTGSDGDTRVETTNSPLKNAVGFRVYECINENLQVS